MAKSRHSTGERMRLKGPDGRGHEFDVDLCTGTILYAYSNEDDLYQGLDIEAVSDMIVNPHCYRGTALLDAQGNPVECEDKGSIQGNTLRAG